MPKSMCYQIYVPVPRLWLLVVAWIVLSLGTVSEAFQVPATRTSHVFISPLVSHQTTTTTKSTRKGQSWTYSTRASVLVQALEEEYPTFKEDAEDSSSSPTSKSSSTNNSPSSNSGGNLVQRIDTFGQSLKPRAREVDARAAQATQTKSRIGLKVKASFYWMLYMAYRGYRGFFVILPAVFREVYSKMETAVDYRVLDDNNTDDNNADITAIIAEESGKDTNPATGKVRWRTRITVSVLAGIVTMTYVFGGLARVILKFAKTIFSTSSLSNSFSAAANEVEDNEGRLMKLSSSSGKKGGPVNGSESKDVGL